MNLIVKTLKSSLITRNIFLVIIIAFLCYMAKIAFGFSESLIINTVLSQLITITALINTLIYTVLIPKALDDINKKNQLIISYKNDCDKILALQWFCDSFYCLLLSANKIKPNAIEEFYEFFYKEKFHMNKLSQKEVFYELMGKLINMDNPPDDVAEAKLYNRLRSELVKPLDRQLLMLGAYLEEFVRPAGRIFMQYETSAEAIFSPAQLVSLKLSLRKIVRYAWLDLPDINDRLLDNNSNIPHGIFTKEGGSFWDRRKMLYKYMHIVNSDIVKLSNNPVNPTYPSIIVDTMQQQQPRIDRMIRNLDLIINTYSSKNYKSFFINSGITGLFGIFIPLIVLTFKVNFFDFITLACIAACLGALISFLIDVYFILNSGSDELNFEPQDLGF